MTKTFTHPMTIPALMITIVIDIMGVGLVFPILPALFSGSHPWFTSAGTSMSLNNLYYGLAIGTWTLGIFFGSPYLGDLSDKYGRKPMVMLCLLGTAFTYGLGAIAIMTHSLWGFLASRLLSGFFAGSFGIAQSIIADISATEDKARNMGYITLSASLGIVIGPFISALTSSNEWLSWATIDTPFWIAMIISSINLVSIWLLLKETHVVKTHLKISILKVFSAFAFVFMDPRTRGLALPLFLIQLGWGYYIQGIPLVMAHQFNYGSHMIGFFFSASGLACAAALLWIQPSLLRHISLKSAIISTSILAGTCLWIAVIYPALWVQWAMIALTSAMEVISFNCTMATFSNVVTAEEQGKVLGGTGAVFGAAWLINGLTVGVIVSLNLWYPVAVAGSALLIAGIAMFYYRKSL